MAGEQQNQDPTKPAGSQGERTYTEQEFNAKVSAELGARLGPVPAETMALFRENPALLNEMLVTNAVIKGDPELLKRVQALTGGRQGESQVQTPTIDVDSLMREAEKKSGVELNEETRKVLTAFGHGLVAVQSQNQVQVARQVAREVAPDAMRALTREEQWDVIRASDEFKANKTLARTTRDILNENWNLNKREGIPLMTPTDAFDQAKKELALPAGAPQNTAVPPAQSSQPRSPFTPSTQATGTTQGNQAQSQGAVSASATQRISYRDAVKGSITDAAWQEMIRGVPDKRPSGS